MNSAEPALLHDTSLMVAKCYQDYHHPPQGYDYQLCPYPRNSIFFSFAIHGGKIEVQTSELTLEMSTDVNNKMGEVWNTYYFEGLRPSNNSALHVTATHYDDPTLLGMIYNTSSPSFSSSSSPSSTPSLLLSSQTQTSDKWCVSNHGFKWDEPEVCVGGASELLRNNTIAALSKKYGSFVAVFDASTNPYCSSIAGLSPQNVVNLCSQGLQLEMSSGLRDEFALDPAFRLSWAQTVRETVMSSAKEVARS